MHHDATKVVQLLAQRQQRLVLAESCTGGLVAGELAKIPGVSQWLCGSAVTYRSDTKVKWLGVREATLAAHTAVSDAVAVEMVRGVLQRTPEATIAASITGHLGPDAPSGYDGVVFIAVAQRGNPNGDESPEPRVERHLLESQGREPRQREAVSLVLKQILVSLQD
jgi:PncC family amidohydrolase